MNKHPCRYLELCICIGLLSTGCTTVVRENIISSVNTGVGFTLAENPKTELYEVKLGFIRSQFYSVPTGKTVKGDKQECCSRQELSNHAEHTPELVSGIKMNSDFRHLFVGATVSENFAVGKVAVMSPAAVAMYVASAPNKQTAEAAAKAASALTKLRPSAGAAPVDTIDGVVAFIKGLPQGDYPKAKEVLADLESTGDLTPRWDFDRYAWETVNSVLLINDPATAALSSGYDGFKTYRGTLQQSISVLESVITNANVRTLQVKAAGAAAAPISDAQIVSAGRSLEVQTARLKSIDQQFAEHPAVSRVLDYFASIVKPASQ